MFRVLWENHTWIPTAPELINSDSAAWSLDLTIALLHFQLLAQHFPFLTKLSSHLPLKLLHLLTMFLFMHLAPTFKFRQSRRLISPLPSLNYSSPPRKANCTEEGHGEKQSDGIDSPILEPHREQVQGMLVWRGVKLGSASWYWNMDERYLWTDDNFVGTTLDIKI